MIKNKKGFFVVRGLSIKKFFELIDQMRETVRGENDIFFIGIDNPIFEIEYFDIIENKSYFGAEALKLYIDKVDWNDQNIHVPPS